MTRETIQAWLDKPAREVDLGALTRALEVIDGEVSASEDEIQRQRQELDRLKADRDALVGYRNFIAHFSGAEPTTPASRSPARKGTKRDAIFELLGDGAEWPTPAIRESLVSIGIMGDGDRDYHSLQVTLSRMFRQGELARPRQAVYQLSSATAGETPFEAIEGVLAR